jgi:carboxypeptidase Taq
MLLPHLRENVELTRRYADCFDGFPGFTQVYDALLDEYEPEMTTEQMRGVLADLREGLVPLVNDAADNGAGSNGDPFRGEFPSELQRELVAELIGNLPFPEASWRIDPTEHPFAISIGTGDVRLTTRYDEGNLAMALFSAMHEAGHGLYESGVDPELRRTPLSKPRSLGLHESREVAPIWADCCRAWSSSSRAPSTRSTPRSSIDPPTGWSAR